MLGMISVGGQVGNPLAQRAVNSGSSLGHSDSDDHYNGDSVSLGPIPCGM